MSIVAAARSSGKLGRPRQIEDDAIFTAMTAVLLRVGWARLTLSLVAREVGITPAALRQRFGGKHDLLVAFYAWGTQNVRATLFDSAGIPGGATPLDDLRTMAQRSVAPFSTAEHMVNAVSALTEVVIEADLRALARERVTLLLKKFELILEEAVARGELADVNAAMLARQLHISLIGVCVVWAITGEGVLAEAVQQIIDAVLEPYRPRGDRTTNGAAKHA